MLDKMSKRNIIDFKEVEFRPQSEPPRPSYVPGGTPPYDRHLRKAHTSDLESHSPINKPRKAHTKSSGADISSMSDSDDDIELKVVNVQRPKYHQGNIVTSGLRVVTKAHSGASLEVASFV